jgi:hypothetical protein
MLCGIGFQQLHSQAQERAPGPPRNLQKVLLKALVVLGVKMELLYLKRPTQTPKSFSLYVSLTVFERKSCDAAY